MEQKTYPDVSHIFVAKEERRRQLAALSWEEKVKIIEKMREAMPRGMGRNIPTVETETQRLKRYRTSIKKVIDRYCEVQKYTSTAEFIPIFDERNANYLLVALPVETESGKYTTLLHLRIKDNHVVIEVDCTEEGIRSMLIDVGIPETAIITSHHAGFSQGDDPNQNSRLAGLGRSLHLEP